MLMAVNVGNTRISVGFFDDDNSSVKYAFEISTDPSKTVDEYFLTIKLIAAERGVDLREADGGIVSSVVPQLTATICETVSRFCSKEPLVVGPGVKTGFPIKIDSPAELGGDMVANAAAVVSVMKQKNDMRATVIVDVGSVTTVSAINARGEYVGCSIMPGVQMSLEALHGKTALLPNVSYLSQTKAIGKNSQEAVLSGVMLGHAIMIDGFVTKFAKEMKAEAFSCVITGEYAKHVIPLCRSAFEYERELTLKGLYFIYQRSKETKV
ncbi:MAG: type III pantothenate kinase [Ruminococcaceae bacterium]|nr:type III pantothenate kinase [Oscillospiraceae bacterium]